jgi:transposase
MSAHHFTHHLGIDVSAEKLDAHLLGSDTDLPLGDLPNAEKDIADRLERVFSDNSLDRSSTVICAEYTGHYIYPLAKACTAGGYLLWLESGGQVKAASGLVRGKSDKVDAQRIALYAKRFCDRYRPFEPMEATLEEIALLSRERDMYVSDRAGYRQQLTSMKGFMPKQTYDDRKKRFDKVIKELSKHIRQVEKEIEALLEGDDNLKGQFETTTSVPGIGKETAIGTLVATKGFTKFDSARQFCCHIGVAPFTHSSGKSIKGKAHVSKRADKRLKALFSTAAVAAIKVKGGEFRQYYERKLKEGKEKMSVINAIRAKLVARAFALIRDGRRYEKEYHFSMNT